MAGGLSSHSWPTRFHPSLGYSEDRQTAANGFLCASLTEQTTEFLLPLRGIVLPACHRLSESEFSRPSNELTKTEHSDKQQNILSILSILSIHVHSKHTTSATEADFDGSVWAYHPWSHIEGSIFPLRRLLPSARKSFTWIYRMHRI